MMKLVKILWKKACKRKKKRAKRNIGIKFDKKKLKKNEIWKKRIKNEHKQNKL
jgi:hypothetical protein